ncbi:hypothetical protein [Microtetraspora malaysiensis]|uniref:Uncharacterized protein n=1 Tax=Microtetraspora malaysiensis TaxID=161358 RepID=A0ABW6T439_9ACTN
MRVMRERVTSRLTAHVDRLPTMSTRDDQREAVVRMLSEVLPLDEERRRTTLTSEGSG